MQNTENRAEAQQPTKKERAKQRRQELKQLSQTLQPLVDSGHFKNINEALIHTYQQRQDEPTLFKSMYAWNQEGYRVKKGSTAFAIWGRPKTTERDGEEVEYFPMAYLFASHQVEERQTPKS